MKPKQQLLAIVLLISCTLLVIGFSSGQQTVAQSPSDDYGGFDECDSCHGRVGREFESTAHRLSMFSPEDYPDAVVGDFTQDNDTRPFMLEEVTWVIGSGRMIQRYVTKTEEDVYQLLPTEWNTVLQAWQPLSVTMDTPFEESCATCHTTGYDEEKLEWVDAGVTCEACHGEGWEHIELADDAGSRIDDEEEEAILAAIVAYPQAETCASCHSQTIVIDDAIHQDNLAYSLWHTSPHKQSDADANILSCDGCHAPHGDGDLVSLSADVETDGCIACHDNFSTTLMTGEPIIEQVLGQPSAHHGEDFACTSCHSAHAVSALPDDPAYTPACLDCHTNLSNTAIHNFVNSTQESVTNRLANIQDVVTDESPEWVQAVVTEINRDGSMGLHNIRYVSQLLDAVEFELGLQTALVSSHIPNVAPSDPIDCAECHGEIHATWQGSYHANASLGETFQQAYAENGQPSYCMSCHASGYDEADADLCV